MKSRVQVLKEVPKNINTSDWKLCFQWCQYHYDNGTNEFGYRFIWRKPDGSLQPARGQARIPSTADIFELLALASKNGWLNK